MQIVQNEISKTKNPLYVKGLVLKRLIIIALKY